MFGFKKKTPRPNPLWTRIHDQMRHELHHNDDEESKSYEDKYADVPFLPRGMRNNAISQSLYFQIEPEHRIIWHKIDLDEYFEKEEGVKDIDTISRTAIDVRLLSYDLDLTKKADALGVKRDKKYSDEVGL